MKYLSLIALLFTFSSYGIGPKQFDIKDFFSDAKFIGTGVVISGFSLPKSSLENFCGATFEVLVVIPILGAKKVKSLNYIILWIIVFHLLKLEVNILFMQKINLLIN